MSPRWAESVPSLVRLLADLSAERLRTVAVFWDVEEPVGSAAVYRRMTTPEAARAVRDGLDARARLLFDTVVALRPIDRDGLRRRLPFGDDELDDLLANLEGRGLIWPRVARVESSAARRVWFVASDLVKALAQPATRSPGKSAIGPPPTPAPLDQEPAEVRTFGQVPRLLTSLGTNLSVERPSPSAVRDYARHCGIALGVWTETLEPGPRCRAWQNLDESGQLRALARLWLVDDSAPGVVPEALRQACWETLPTLAIEKWYNLDEVARWIAREAGRTGIGRAFGRDQIESAVVTLAWLGVLRFAVDRRERPSALSLNRLGAEALG